MTPQTILRINATSTAACGIAMLAFRGLLYPLFGLDAPLLIDALAIVFLAYAAALVVTARQQPVDPRALMAFAAVDALSAVACAAALVLFWSPMTPIARVLVVMVGLTVEAFAALQFKAAGGWGMRRSVAG